MAEEALIIINALEDRFREQGFTRYSFRPQDIQPTLIMYNTVRKQFTIIVYSPNEPGAFSRTDVFLDMAESKAEVFGEQQIPPYRVFKNSQGRWRIENEKEEIQP